MEKLQKRNGCGGASVSYGSRLMKDMRRDKWLYLLLSGGILFILIFKYVPIYGLRIAFMEYNQFDPDASKWVGFDQFTKLFGKRQFIPVLQNTLIISLSKLIIGFPVPIILALMLNEIRSLRFKKLSQTLLYLPHFVSWVIMGGIIMTLLDPANGMITQFIHFITGENIAVLTDPKWFVPMLVVTDVYKTMGWGTIIYFAAISGVDQEQYEAAAIDGAGRWRQTRHITLPAIKPTIIIVFILNLGNVLNAGFEQIFMLYSSLVYETADVIDTYVYRLGVIKSDYSFSTAAGMFKSVVALVLILMVNQIAKRSGNEGVW